jgi:transposase
MKGGAETATPTMPKLLFARPPQDAVEARQIRKLAASRHAPGDWIRRAQMIERSWAGWTTTRIAAALRCHPQTVRERFVRFNAEGVDGLGDLPGGGRTPRLTEAERSQVLALAATTPAGRLERGEDGALEAVDEAQAGEWTLDTLTEAAGAAGIRIARSQVRRIFLAERVRWRRTRTWGTSTDPDFAPKGPGSSPCTPARPRGRRSSTPTSWAR